MMVLGYPQGLSANAAGFPILRSGRVASPIEAARGLADLPARLPRLPRQLRRAGVHLARPPTAARRRPGPGRQFIAGMLTQQVELNNERLEIGIVTDAEFIRETLAELDGPAPATAPVTAPAASPVPSRDVSARVGAAVGD